VSAVVLYYGSFDKVSGLITRYPPTALAFTWGDMRKTTKKFRTVGILDEIQTRYLIYKLEVILLVPASLVRYIFVCCINS
jgi:hypothetical protein